MNILILNWRDPKNPKSGGAERVTMEHAKGWIEAGHKVTWFTSRFPKCKSKEIMNGIEFIRKGNFITVYAHAPLYYMQQRKKFDFIVDEIHGMPFFTPLYVKKPKIAFIHEVAGDIWNYMYPFPISAIGKVTEPLILSLYKNTPFLTVSNSTKESLTSIGIKPSNITIVQNGIDNKPVLKIPKKEKVPTFIFVSRVVKMKGIEDIIESFSRIQKSYKDAKLWIVGDGEIHYINHLRSIIKNHKISQDVKFFGKVTEQKKFELLKRAHVLLHASVKEGWGLVVIEAASQATPSVVYNVPGLRDSVKNNVTGVVLKTNTPSEMSKQAVALLADKKKYTKFQKNGIQLSKNLTWNKATDASICLINSVETSG